jgi:hypothetical protein
MKTRCAKQFLSLAVLILTLAAVGMTLHAQTYTPLYTYPETNQGDTGILPAGLMSQGRDGLLYSTDAYNGANHAGTVFNMTTSGLPTTVYTFCPQAGCKDGAYPLGGVTRLRWKSLRDNSGRRYQRGGNRIQGDSGRNPDPAMVVREQER